MIKRVTKDDEIKIKEYIRKDVYQNVYLYMDFELYGLSNKNVDTYMLITDNCIKVILLKYYNSIQLFKVNEIDNEESEEIVNYVIKNKFDMICGVTELIEKISEKLKSIYRSTDGYIFSNESKINVDKMVSIEATENDFDDIVDLICSNDGIGGHYIPSVLKEQFIDRKNSMDCKNIVIKEDNKIVCHAATYANSKILSVIGGVITRDGYTGKGYGKQIVNELSLMIQLEGKTPILYCYDPKIMDWYMNMGWKKKNTSSKLELISK